MSFEFSNQIFFQPVLADIGLTLLQLLLFFVSLWLIFLILIQRGKGGGLTAAFGGGGGDSAFGAKAGDAFTKITIVSALVWITLCMVTIARYNPPAAAVNPFDETNQENVEFEDAALPGIGAEDPEAETDNSSDSGDDSEADSGSEDGDPDDETTSETSESGESTSTEDDQ